MGWQGLWENSNKLVKQIVGKRKDRWKESTKIYVITYTVKMEGGCNISVDGIWPSLSVLYRVAKSRPILFRTLFRSTMVGRRYSLHAKKEMISCHIKPSSVTTDSCNM